MFEAGKPTKWKVQHNISYYLPLSKTYIPQADITNSRLTCQCCSTRIPWKLSKLQLSLPTTTLTNTSPTRWCIQQNTVIHLHYAGLCTGSITPQDVPCVVVAQEQLSGNGILGEGWREGRDLTQAGLPSLAPGHSPPSLPALFNKSHPLS